MIRTIAVDDEPLALQLICSYIEKIPYLELVGSYDNAFEAKAAIESGGIDLVFLDIQMPDLTGIEMASTIDTFQTKVVFVTAYDSFALDGFRVDAIDYLLKPVDFATFTKSAQKAQRLIERMGDTTAPDHIVVKSNYRLIKINCDQILYIESLRDYVVIVLEDGSEIKTISTIKSMEANLQSPPFYRIHRSFIVNINKISVIERRTIIFGRKQIPISDSYWDLVANKIGV